MSENVIFNNSLIDISHKDILIVDDQPNNLRLLSNFLTKEGYEVRKALNGKIALMACENLPPDLVLLDVMMPGLDGYEVCHLLKSNPKTCEIPIIFISALNESFDKVKAFQVGGSDYITKPLNNEEVLVRVKHQLMIRSLQKQFLEQNQLLEELNKNLEKVVSLKTKQLINQEKTATIGRLTQGLFHNLRNPLHNILLTLGLLEQMFTDKGLEKKGLEYTECIKDYVLQISQIMDSLLTKSRLDQKSEVVWLNINDMIQRELQLFHANLYFKNKIKKIYSLDQTLPEIPLVYSNFSQVFTNLVNNAIDAVWNREQREITIITRQDTENIYIEIADTGCGIAPENLSKIFDPFYTSKPMKGEEKHSGEPTGTGLGLYTCVELLKPFQGEIEVKSEIEKGSLFTVKFPKNSPLQVT